MTKKLIFIALLIVLAAMLISCGMTAKETEVEDISEAPFGYNAETMLPTGSPTYNIDDLTGSVTHNEFTIVYCNNGTKAYLSIGGRDGISLDYDIYQSTLVNGTWTEPTTNGLTVINHATADDFIFYISPDGQRMYLSSNRAGGFGNQDIYLATTNVGVWQAPANLGPTINSALDEVHCVELNSGNEIYFSSNNTGGTDYDLWRAVQINGIWQTPTTDVFTRVNKSIAVNDEYGAILSSDANTLYFSSNRYDGKWRFYKSSWAEDKWDHPVMIQFPDHFLDYVNDICYLSEKDNKIYFTSSALTAGDSIEDYNLWTIERK